MPLVLFNWRPAMYAHASWWPDLPAAFIAKAQPMSRLTARVSASLLTQLDLNRRYLLSMPAIAWPLYAGQTIRSLAFELGLALLGARICSTVDRASVRAQEAALGAQARSRAIRYAQQWPAVAAAGTGLRLPADRAELVDCAGLVMVELARRACGPGSAQSSDHDPYGVADRLRLHFARNACLDTAQRPASRPASDCLDQADQLLASVLRLMRERPPAGPAPAPRVRS